MEIDKKHLDWAVGIFLLVGIAAYVGGFSLYSIIPFLLSGVTYYGSRHLQKDHISTLSNALSSLLEENVELQSHLSEEREKRQKKAQRLENLKRILEREGIDTNYLVDKYGKSLKFIVMALTHFRAPEWNSQVEEEVIRSNLDELGTEVVQGGTRVIPPTSVDQDISTQEELRTWFEENVLGGNKDITHKLELLALVDLSKVYGNDTTGEDQAAFGMQVINDIFDLDRVIPTQELIDILTRIERISLRDELEENVALLAVPYATNAQFDQILSHQQEIEEEMGDVQSISNMDPGDIEFVLQAHGVDESEGLARGIRQEAIELTKILDSELSISLE